MGLSLTLDDDLWSSPKPSNSDVSDVSDRYFSFLFSVLGDSLIGLQDNKPFMRYLGIAGLFSLIAIGLYNNTQDSFATPNIWLIPGVVAGIMANANFVARAAVVGGISSAEDGYGSG